MGTSRRKPCRSTIFSTAIIDCFFYKSEEGLFKNLEQPTHFLLMSM